MVEFGLKLEDNKVAEWRENYIDYEKLKQILKKCAAAVARYQDLADKQPKRAALIKENFENGQDTPVATPHTSLGNLAEVDAATKSPSEAYVSLHRIRESSMSLGSGMSSNVSDNNDVLPRKKHISRRHTAALETTMAPQTFPLVNRPNVRRRPRNSRDWSNATLRA